MTLFSRPAEARPAYWRIISIYVVSTSTFIINFLEQSSYNAVSDVLARRYISHYRLDANGLGAQFLNIITMCLAASLFGK